jgi:hypothetical protein
MPYRDQKFRLEYEYALAGKRPFIAFADTEKGTNGGYINTSLEGLLFDDATIGNPPGGSTGEIVIPTGVVTPKFNYYQTLTATELVITAVDITNEVCTVTCVSSVESWLNIGDLVGISGVRWDTTHPFVNGCWKVTGVSGSTFTFDINAPDTTTPFQFVVGVASKGPAFEILDDRAITDAMGQSFTSTFFTPAKIVDLTSGWKRILPSDLYTRFKFQTGSDVNPQGGINTDLFNVVDSSNNNIKPVLWAYFFGYSSSTAPTGSPYEVPFNSYAIVLRPSGDGSRLEFAIVKFNWGLISDWFNDVISAESEKYKNWSDLDLGYLIATNPETGKVGTSSVITELAKSDSFTYNSAFAAKFNLKITIRKHMLSDSVFDGTYLVNLMVNDDYYSFGEGAHYDSVMHAYIDKPVPISITTNSTEPHDYMLMPWMYFKFNNIDKNSVGISTSPADPGSSKIVQDSLIFRQLNASEDTSYLY